MSSQAEFNKQRIEDKLEKLNQEQEQLGFNLVRTRRDEQIALDRIRREFDTRYRMSEARQVAITKEIKELHRDLERAEEQIIEERREEMEAEKTKRDEQHRRRFG